MLPKHINLLSPNLAQIKESKGQFENKTTKRN